MKSESKELLKKEISDCLRSQTEIERIVIFGSFLNSQEPNDIDIAIFEDSDESYLDLSMKYRRLTRSIARKIPSISYPSNPLRRIIRFFRKLSPESRFMKRSQPTNLQPSNRIRWSSFEIFFRQVWVEQRLHSNPHTIIANFTPPISAPSTKAKE